jgi:hypothetical protein
LPIVNVSAKTSFRAKKRILRAVCQEIVPAALNSHESPLSPGCIQFKYSNIGKDDINTDVLIEIRAYKSNDRLINREERAELIRKVLSDIFGNYSIWIDLVDAGYSSDGKDPDIGCDMSMQAAVNRLMENRQLKL